MGETRVLDELSLAGLKRERVRRSLEQAQAKASDILLFAVQWRDLENHYDLVESKLQKKCKEVELKEKELGTKSLALDERASKIEAAEAEAGVLKLKAEGFRREVEAKQRELGALRNRVETCACELKKEEKRLAEIRTLVKGCENDLRSKSKQLAVMLESVRETQGELELKEKELRQAKTELARCCDEVNAEKENLGKIQNTVRQCEDVSERRMRDLTIVLENRDRADQQLALVEEQLGSRQQLLEIRSSELESKSKELNAVRESIRSCDIALDLKRKEVQSLENSIREFREHLESKKAELGGIQRLIDEQTHELEVRLKRRDSIEELIRKNIEELVAKEKKQEEMSEALRRCSMEFEFKEKKLAGTEDNVKKLLEKLHSEEKHLDSTQKHLKQCTIELESKQNDLGVLNKTLRKSSMDLESKQRDFSLLQLRIADYHKQIEAREKKVQDLESSIEEIDSKLRVKQDMHTSIERLVKNLIDELAFKEHELGSVKMKIEETVKEHKSKEEQFIRLEESLKECRTELELKEKQFDARVKNLELREKQLESERKKFSKCVDEFEQKVEKMSRFCQQGKTDQSDNLLRDPKPKVDESLLILLDGYLKKCPQLHIEVSDVLKTSSDPAGLVLDMIQRFYSPHPAMKETELGEDVVRKSCICLLECLLDISPVIKPGVRSEAIKLATTFKNKMQVKEESAVEVLGFLYFLAAFSLAYSFGADELQSLFDIDTLRKYAPSLGKALGLSSLASVNDFLSSDIKVGQPLDKPVDDNATRTLSLDIQPNEAVSELVCELQPREGALMDSEVSAVLRSSPDPAKFVLDRIQEAIRGTNQQGVATPFEESVVNYCILLLEELVKISREITPHVRHEASKLAIVWKGKLQIGNPAVLEALGFLLLLAAYNVVDMFNRVEISNLAYSVAFYKHSPELFQSLGLSDVIPDFVLRLVGREHYIPAARLICAFELTRMLSPMPLIKKEFEDLRQSSANIHVETTSVDSQGECRDLRKMRAILELIADYKLDIDIPGELAAKFMLKRGNQRSPSVIPSIPTQHPAPPPPPPPPAVQMQPPYAALPGSGGASHMTNPVVLSHPQGVGVYNYQVMRARSQQNQGGVKRVRPETMHQQGREMVRPCVNPRYRFHPPGNGGC